MSLRAAMATAYRHIRADSIGRLYLIAAPLVAMAASVFVIASDSLHNNSRALVEYLRFREMAIECLANVFRQDDSSKALIINPDDPTAGRAKIAAYDRNQYLMTRMGALASDPKLSSLIAAMKEVDERQLREADTTMLEALAEGRRADGMRIYQDHYVPGRNKFEELVQETRQRGEQLAQRAAAEMERQNDDTLRRIGLANLIGLLGIAAIVVILIRGVSRHLNEATNELRERSLATREASEIMRRTNDALAEDASRTAAELELANTSLAEIAGMTRVNAEHCATASGLARKSLEEVQKSGQAVAILKAAMAEIFEMSKKAAGIARSMDEIAFQTNILALNAAVEAARAGMVGAGFGVVANEVRNLALRSADSARAAGSLIEASIAAAKRGVNAAQDVDRSLSQVIGQAEEVTDTVGNINASSQEQRLSLDSIAHTMRSIDRTTQINTTRATEGVEQARALKATADSIGPLIDRFLALVGSHSGADA